MTVRELIKQLEDMDDEIKDYRVRIRITKRWNETYITVEGDIIKIPEECDVDLKRFTLEAI